MASSITSQQLLLCTHFPRFVRLSEADGTNFESDFFRLFVYKFTNILDRETVHIIGENFDDSTSPCVVHHLKKEIKIEIFFTYHRILSTRTFQISKKMNLSKWLLLRSVFSLKRHASKVSLIKNALCNNGHLQRFTFFETCTKLKIPFVLETL